MRGRSATRTLDRARDTYIYAYCRATVAVARAGSCRAVEDESQGAGRVRVVRVLAPRRENTHRTARRGGAAHMDTWSVHEYRHTSLCRLYGRILPARARLECASSRALRRVVPMMSAFLHFHQNRLPTWRNFSRLQTWRLEAAPPAPAPQVLCLFPISSAPSSLPGPHSALAPRWRR